MLSPSTLSKRIPRWVNLKSPLSSISCTSSIQINPEIDQNISNTPDFDAKIQFLRNKLHPDNLIKLLQSTADINSAVKIFKWASLQKRFDHTSDTYYWMILKLGLAGHLKEMEGFCQNLVKDRCSGVEHAFVSLIEAFVRHRRLNEATCILANMSLGGCKISINVFNSILRALVEDKKGFKDVMFVYKEMVKAGATPTVDTLNYLIQVLFETERVDFALDQYKRMNKKGCCPNSRTFEIVISGLITNNRVNDSIVVLLEMLKLECLLDLTFFTCIIPLLCRENKVEEAIKLFGMMQTSKVIPNLVIYSALIQCLCKNLRLDDALNLLQKMVESGLTPDNNVFVDVVNEFCRLGKINEAGKFLEDNNVLEASPYNALLQCCCDAGEFAAAKGLLEQMSERSLADCDSWNILIRWLCEKAESRRANALLGRMIISTLIPNSATYSALVIGHCRSSDYGDALQLFLQTRTKSWVLDTIAYSQLIENLCKAGKHLEATEVFCYMFENGRLLESPSFSILIKGICERGMVNEAVRLQQMAHDSGMCCADDTSSYIMHGLSKSDNERNLLVFVSQILVKGCNLNAEAYCILMKSMIAQNRGKDCALFFTSMVDEGLIPDSDTFHTILLYLANHSQLDLVSATIDKLLNAEALDLAMYNILVNGFWKEGFKNKARRLLDSMLEKGWVPDATTHRLLMGCVDRVENYEEMSNLTVKDGVVDILDEGLGGTSGYL